MESRQDDVRSAKSWLPKFLRRDNKSNEERDTPPNERSTLLPKPDDEEEGDVYDLDDGERSKWHLILLEFWVLVRGSVPVILAYTLQMSLQTVSVLIVGRLSPEALATAAFAYMFAMATGWLIALGGTTAIDTLASATFTGSKNKTDLGIILQRSFIILFLFYVPVAILWVFAEPIFNVLGQEPYLARDAARFLWVLIPGGVGYIYFEAMKKYLQAQGKQHHLQMLLFNSAEHISRNYATGDIRASHHLSYQRCPELSFRLHVRDWTTRGSARHQHLLLALLLTACGLRTLCRRLGMLGRLEHGMLQEHVDILPSGIPWSCARGN